MLPTHYISQKLVTKITPDKGTLGVFACEEIRSGELLAVFGGIVVTTHELSQLMDYQQHQAIQVEEGLHLAPFGESEPADYFNHSCDPNAGLDGQIALVALRDIQSGEEVSFDYATSDSTHYDDFDCQCGSNLCRARVTGDDWMKPELQTRYKGYFSPYLQVKIDKLKIAHNS